MLKAWRLGAYLALKLIARLLIVLSSLVGIMRSVLTFFKSAKVHLIEILVFDLIRALALLVRLFGSGLFWKK